MSRFTLWPSLDEYFTSTFFSDLGAQAAEVWISQLKVAGYFKLAVPKKFGGLGASLIECCAAQKALAGVDGGLAVGLNMHLFTIGMLVEHWHRHKDLSWMLLQAVSQNNSLIASAFAEPGLGGSLLRSRTKAQKVAHGYLLNGIKVPCSIAKRCDMICLQAITDEPRPDRLIVGLLPAKSAGIKVKSGRALFGMNNSESDVLCLDDCFLPDTLVLHRCLPGVDQSDVFKASLIWFCLTASAAYLGLLERALEYTMQRMHELKLPPNDLSRAEDPLFQSKLGEAYVMAQSCEMAVAGLAQALSGHEIVPGNALPQALAIKQQTYHVSLSVISQCLDLLGASEFTVGNCLMKWFSDLQAVRYHPPTPLSVNKILGQQALGVAVEFDAGMMTKSNIQTVESVS